MRFWRKDLKKEESHEAAILICQVEKALPLPIIISPLLTPLGKKHVLQKLGVQNKEV